MPRRTVGCGGVGAGAGGAMTCGSVGGVDVTAEITGASCVCTGGGTSGGGTYVSTGTCTLGCSMIFFGGGGGGGGALISSMTVADSGFLITSTSVRPSPLISA